MNGGEAKRSLSAIISMIGRNAGTDVVDTLHSIIREIEVLPDELDHEGQVKILVHLLLTRYGAENAERIAKIINSDLGGDLAQQVVDEISARRRLQ